MSAAFIQGIVVFVLASFVGFEIIRRVPPTLHTPLMSGANAISGITIVGAILAVTLMFVDDLSTLAVTAISILAFLAIVFAMINVVGGFLVTDRMLEMFKKVPGK